MKPKLRKLILATLSYADLFDYPLNLKEIYLFLIGQRCSKEEIVRSLKSLRPPTPKDYWYFLSGRRKIVTIRRSRLFYSRKKMTLARKVAGTIGHFPGVLLVGATGGLAMENTRKDDDIDFLIITAADYLWITRLLLLTLGVFFWNRRKSGEEAVRDKICFNMFMGEEAMSLPRKERDIYSAHEIIQMKPLINRKNTYARFLMHNAWVNRYLPNAWYEKTTSQHPVSPEQGVSKIASAKKMISGFVNNICFRMQFMYMKPKITQEIVTYSYVRFHPRDKRPQVLKYLKARLKRYKVPLDKVFS